MEGKVTRVWGWRSGKMLVKGYKKKKKSVRWEKLKKILNLNWECVFKAEQKSR